MKNLKFLFVIASCLGFVFEANTKIQGRKYCLQMQGIVTQTGNDQYFKENWVDSAVICIHNVTKRTIDTCYSDESGECDFRLPLNNRYLVSISKKGFMTKILNIDTRVAENKKKHFVFPFDIVLFKRIAGLDISNLLKDPIASVNFNINRNDFVYNYNHSHQVNNKIKNIYSDYYHSPSPKNIPSSDTTVKPIVPLQSDNSPEQPISEPEKSKFVYKLQVCSTSNSLFENYSLLENYKITDENYSGGLYKYTIGEFNDIAIARNKLIELKDMKKYFEIEKRSLTNAVSSNSYEKTFSSSVLSNPLED